MNVLIIGSGGREHAFAWKISQSPLLSKLYIAPGNAGTLNHGENINIGVNDFKAIGEFVKSKNIELVLVGPEEPLVRGIRDYFSADEKLKYVLIIGPTSKGAMLEGSKDFAKAFMLRNNIPTARYFSVSKANIEDGKVFLKQLSAPYVLKADGLAAGKGVLILNNRDEAEKELQNMLDGKFGDAGNTVVIEEFLKGIELSVFVLSDGNTYKILPEAKDYKRVGEGDTGLNTGGMGAVSPVSFASKEFMNKVEQKIIIPTVEGLRKEGISYIGFIFLGLINVNNEPFVIEYNARMGDPETEVVIPRIKTDFLELLIATAEGKLDKANLEVTNEVATTVMLVAGGYPGEYKKGDKIENIEKITNSIVFHAGTKKDGESIVTNGGRVLSITSLGKTMEEARARSYNNALVINFKGMHYRRDIGNDLKA
jgi:phosphoribosylamine---glycine ligase